MIVVWDGAATTIDITAAEHMDRPEAMLVLESGETIELVLSPRNGGEGLQLLSTPGDLPFGYHELHVRVGATESTSTVLCKPRVAWTDPRRRWIGFLPLYALHSQRNPGVADLTDLAELGAWLKELGDGLVGTLPLLAGFPEKPVMDPSPYAPVSRLAWNELYVDTGSGAGLSTPKKRRRNPADRLRGGVCRQAAVDCSSGQHRAHESRVEGRNGAIRQRPFGHGGLLQVPGGIIDHWRAVE